MEWIRQSKFFQASLIVAILGILGWLSPFVPLKIVLAFVAIMILAFTFKNYVRHMAGFVVLAIVIFLVPAAINSYSDLVLPIFQNILNLPFVSLSKEVVPSRTIDLKPRVVIDGDLSVDIRFIDSNTMRLADELDVKISEDEVRITTNYSNRKYIIELGTTGLRDLKIDAVAISLSGDCQIDSIDVDGTAININGKIGANRMTLRGTGVNLSGELHGKSLYVEGTGVNLKGEFKFETIRIDGTGISVGMTIPSGRSLSIDGTGVNGIVTYVGQNDFYLKVDGTGGKITLRNQSKADIRIDSSGVKIVRE
ncbi:MAG: hypothetical protein ACK40Q_02640 [Pseudothermotoga sp.]